MNENNRLTNNLPWVEKYRPSNLANVLSQPHVTETLKKFIENKRLPHMIFYGPAGTGKTSSIVSCAKEIYGKDYDMMVLELNASDDRGINTVREQVKDFSSNCQFFTKGIMLVILDEADAMTFDAQFALRRIIENYSNNVRFCLICNYISKIIIPVQSRCVLFRFYPLNNDIINDKLLKICKNEKIRSNKAGIQTITQLCKGDLRVGINLLQSIYLAKGKLATDAVYSFSGLPTPKESKKLTNSIIKNRSFKKNSKIIEALIHNGVSLHKILLTLTDDILHSKLNENNKMNILKKLGEIEKKINITNDEKPYINELSSIHILLDKVGF
jgi:replication factor C subunit 3/5